MDEPGAGRRRSIVMAFAARKSSGRNVAAIAEPTRPAQGWRSLSRMRSRPGEKGVPVGRRSAVRVAIDCYNYPFGSQGFLFGPQSEG